MSEEKDYFNVEEPVEAPKEKKAKFSEGIYAPKIKDGEKIYEATIRFVNFVEGGKVITPSSIERHYHYLDFPNLGGSRYVECGRMQGNGYDCPICGSSSYGKEGMIWRFKKSGQELLKAVSEKMRITNYFYQMVQIVDDKNQPDLNGKIMVFRYGKKLKEKLDAMNSELKGDTVTTALLYAHPIKGMNFKLRLTKSGTYDDPSSSFFLGQSPIKLDGKLYEDSPAQRKALLAYLGTHTKGLNDFPIVGHSADDKQFIDKIAKQYLPRLDGTMPKAVEESKLKTDIVNDPNETPSGEMTSDEFFSVDPMA